MDQIRANTPAPAMGRSALSGHAAGERVGPWWVNDMNARLWSFMCDYVPAFGDTGDLFAHIISIFQGHFTGNWVIIPLIQYHQGTLDMSKYIMWISRKQAMYP